ncbi:hypothetical protein ACJIZ3_005456 [Penstemon smallii]|uniref:Syntaxin 6/10/61 N-terminal domain-containing protein n=1 Tax=Penstemon smallii TaxID=265156 RepID=A0ABD3S535_9LAMI
MLVANSFDLWQKDTFFSAAEEVQQSADIMESAYRTWLRARREGLIPQHLDELERELQMALGTAKWQLEEFERAVHTSYRNNGNDITITRHKQFVSAIEDQIFRVETALKESFNVDKKPFCWVNLDEEECDDLARFLSGTPETSQRNQEKDTRVKNNIMNGHSSLSSENQGKSFGDIATSNEDANCVIELEERKFSEGMDEVSYQVDKLASNRRTWSSPDRTTLEIVIDSKDVQKNALIESTPKEKGSKPFFEKTSKGGVLSHNQLKIFSWINQRVRGSPRFQRQQQISPVHSMRFLLALMLTIFLVVPFLFYST